ncbi:MAG: cupin domain-containing protein [Eubacteriales bacterium]
MKEKTGTVFSIVEDNLPIAGCTVSKEIFNAENSITYFSMAEGTDISAEIYPYYKLILLADGDLTVYGSNGFEKKLEKGSAILAQIDVPVGMKTEKGAVYTEIVIRRQDIMNEVIKAGEIFKLADLLPYSEDKIVNMDVVHNDKMKFMVMAFDEGTGLSEHSAPGEALIFALEGEGVISYDGVEHDIKAGENFHFAKAGLHSVKAKTKFKMALLLTL